jgi:hypothetical protein
MQPGRSGTSIAVNETPAREVAQRFPLSLHITSVLFERRRTKHGSRQILAQILVAIIHNS